MEKESKDWSKIAEEYVKGYLKNLDSSHDWLHIERVRRMAILICDHLNNTPSSEWLVKNPYNESENEYLIKRTIDKEVVEMSALLHDIGDYKYSNDLESSSYLVNEFLKNISYPENKISIILNIVKNISYRSELSKPSESLNQIIIENDILKKNSGKLMDEDSFWGLELAIVQDADRLDAIGAIGIARCFAFGGAKGRLLYDPEDTPDLELTASKYNMQTEKNRGNSLNHFYEKLFKIKDKIKTKYASEIAGKRHQFMEDYVNTLKMEININ